MTALLSRHVTGKIQVQSLWVHRHGEATKEHRTQRDWTLVCDGKIPGHDGKTRPNDGFFPSRDG